MEEIVLSGRRYVSTRKAARDHGYHSDYIGQLLRAGKIQGQKVGRAWYVSAESLEQYLALSRDIDGGSHTEVLKKKIPETFEVPQSPVLLTYHKDEEPEAVTSEDLPAQRITSAFREEVNQPSPGFREISSVAYGPVRPMISDAPAASVHLSGGSNKAILVLMALIFVLVFFSTINSIGYIGMTI